VNKAATIVVIYPYKFLQNHGLRLELDELSKYTNVIVWDLGGLLNPSFISKADFKNFYSSNYKYIQLNTFQSFFGELIKLKNNVLFFQVVRVINLKTWLIFNLIGLSRHKSIVFDNSGIRFLESSKIVQNSHLKYKDLFRKYLTFTPDYYLISGSCISDLLLKYNPKKTQLIKGSSWEYSNSLFNDPNRFISYKYAVLVDGAGPKFMDDRFFKESSKYALTSDEWYPSLVNFFEQVEAACNIKVIIAAHPKSNYNKFPKEFDYRPVYYDVTKELIQSSEFIITRQSTASSFAVIYNKPIIHIYNNQLKADKEFMNNIISANNLYRGRLVNIDELGFMFDSCKDIKVNNRSYTSLISKYLSSSNNKPNYQLILEECFSHLDFKFD
jgi:hypothetical protein